MEVVKHREPSWVTKTRQLAIDFYKDELLGQKTPTEDVYAMIMKEEIPFDVRVDMCFIFASTHCYLKIEEIYRVRTRTIWD